jgi:GH43 family beta-xylosidase
MTRQSRLAAVVIGLTLVVVGYGIQAPGVSRAASFTNPIRSPGQDPSVVYQDGFYSLVQSDGGSLYVYRASTLGGLANAPAVRVWGPECCNLWAPELQWLNGKWYIYYAKDDGQNANHRMYALERTGDSPAGSYVSRGKVFDPGNDRWAIDGAVLQKDDGSLFFLWSGWPGTSDGQQNLYIAPMSNPYTISGSRVLLSQPTNAWERTGMPIIEGPATIKRGGKIVLTYSASGSWTDDYCLGLLTNTDGNVLNPGSWTKSNGCVFSKAPTAYGPGHNSLVRAPDGLSWNVYHANTVAGTGWNGRSIRAQTFSWDHAGHPIFGTPQPAGSSINETSGGAAVFTLVNRNSGKCLDVSGASTANGAKIQIWTCNGTGAQQWRLDELGNGFHRLLNANSGRPLDVAGCGTGDGVILQQWGWLNNNCQQFRFFPVVDGWLRIENRNSGKAVDVAGCGTVDGTQVQQWTWLDNGCQQFRLEPVGTVVIVNKNSGKVVDVSGVSTADGANIHQWTYVGGANQHWSFAHVDNGHGRLTARHSGKVMEGHGVQAMGDGVNVDQWTYDGSMDMQWRIEPLNDGYMRIVARHSGKVVDVAGCGTGNGVNVHLWTWLNNDCQRFRLVVP